MVVGPNTTPQNRLARWGLPPLINTLSGHHLSDVGLLTGSLIQNFLWSLKIYLATEKAKEEGVASF